MVHRPREVAQKLGISPSTLRLWSNQFSHELSELARKEGSSGAGPTAQRRYTAEDLQTLAQVKELLAEGLTYEETRRKLRKQPAETGEKLPTEGDTEPSISQGPLADPQITLDSMQQALEAKEKTVAALKESLAFVDVYLRTVHQEREDARSREQHLRQAIELLRAEMAEPAEESRRAWWKRLLAIP